MMPGKNPQNLDEHFLQDAVYVDHTRGAPVITSTAMATCLGRPHQAVLKNIERVMEMSSRDFVSRHFIPLGKSYVLTKDGFLLAATGFNGGAYMRTCQTRILQCFCALEEELRETNESMTQVNYWNDLVHTRRMLTDILEERDLMEKQRNYYRSIIPPSIPEKSKNSIPILL